MELAHRGNRVRNKLCIHVIANVSNSRFKVSDTGIDEGGAY